MTHNQLATGSSPVGPTSGSATCNVKLWVAFSLVQTKVHTIISGYYSRAPIPFVLMSPANAVVANAKIGARLRTEKKFDVFMGLKLNFCILRVKNTSCKNQYDCT